MERNKPHREDVRGRGEDHFCLGKRGGSGGSPRRRRFLSASSSSFFCRPSPTRVGQFFLSQPIRRFLLFLSLHQRLSATTTSSATTNLSSRGTTTSTTATAVILRQPPEQYSEALFQSRAEPEPISPGLARRKRQRQRHLRPSGIRGSLS